MSALISVGGVGGVGGAVDIRYLYFRTRLAKRQYIELGHQLFQTRSFGKHFLNC